MTHADAFEGIRIRASQPLHLGRWIGAAVVLFCFVFIVQAFVASPNIQWDEVGSYFTAPTILEGLKLTLFLSIVSQLIGVLGGVLIAVMRLSKNPVLRSVSWVYILIFRGTPALLQIIFWFNLALVFPTIFGFETNILITATVAAILGLGLNEIAYMAEIVRAGIESVDHGQSEAAQALGLRRPQIIRKVVLPQAMRAIIPPTGNEFIGMLKSTSLVSVIAAQELLTAAQDIYSTNFLTIELLFVASAWYLILTTVATVAQAFVERKFTQGERVRPPLPGAWAVRMMRDFWERKHPEHIDWGIQK